MLGRGDSELDLLSFGEVMDDAAVLFVSTLICIVLLSFGMSIGNSMLGAGCSAAGVIEDSSTSLGLSVVVIVLELSLLSALANTRTCRISNDIALQVHARLFTWLDSTTR